MTLAQLAQQNKQVAHFINTIKDTVPAADLAALLAQDVESALKSYTFFLGKGISQNKKTGPITQTYTSCNSCPERCIFKATGVCYAKSGPVGMQWNKANGCLVKGKSVAQQITMLKQALNSIPTTNLVRHNIAGDIAIENTSDINILLVAVLIDAFQGHRAYTYTHCTPNARNMAIVKAAIAAGFTINFSTESTEEAETVYNSGLPAVIAVDSMSANKVNNNGVNYVCCPYNLDSTRKCASCQICANAGRKCVVAMPVHGVQAKVNYAHESEMLIRL